MTRYLNAKNGIEILHDSGVTQILAGEHPPDEVGVDAHLGSIYMCSCTSGTIYKKSGLLTTDWTPDYEWSAAESIEIIKDFIELKDTPATYSGAAGRYVRVSTGEDGLEFDELLINFLELLDTPATYSGSEDYILKVKSTADGVEFIPFDKSFLELTDTPTDYTNSSGLVPRVNATEDGLEFTATDKAFPDLTDVPATYSGYEGMYPRVNASGTGIEYDFIEFDIDNPEAPLIPETAISGTYFVNFEAGRLLIGATGAKPDLVYLGPVAGLGFAYNADEACYGSFKIPYAWHTDKPIKMKLNFMVDELQSGTTTCAWRMDFHSYNDGESYFDKTTTTVNLDFTLPLNCPAGTFQTEDLELPPDDVNNPISRGDIITFKLYRAGSNSVDTMTGDAVLLALMVEMTTGQHVLGDA